MTEERKQKAKNFQIKIRPKNNKLHMQRIDAQDKIISKEELAKYSSRNQNKFEEEKYKTKDSNKGMKQDKLEKELIVWDNSYSGIEREQDIITDDRNVLSSPKIEADGNIKESSAQNAIVAWEYSENIRHFEWGYDSIEGNQRIQQHSESNKKQEEVKEKEFVRILSELVDISPLKADGNSSSSFDKKRDWKDKRAKLDLNKDFWIHNEEIDERK